MKEYIVAVPEHLAGDLFKDDPELIRCKDCINICVGYIDGVPEMMACIIHQQLVDPLDYCSKGKRKE